MKLGSYVTPGSRRNVMNVNEQFIPQRSEIFSSERFRQQEFQCIYHF